MRLVPWFAVMAVGLVGCRGQSGTTASKADFEARGLTWPLTVEQGRLGCDGLARYVEVDGRKYGLNGFATAAKGYSELEPIWRWDEAHNRRIKSLTSEPVTQLRVSIGDMLGETERLCAG